MGGVCIAASRLYKSKRNIILGAGILFVAAGNVIILYVHLCIEQYLCLCMCVCAWVQVYCICMCEWCSGDYYLS